MARRLGYEGSKAKQIVLLLLVVSIPWEIYGTALAAEMDAALQECLIQALQKADNSLTVGELKAACQVAPGKSADETITKAEVILETPLDERLKKEAAAAVDNLWTITPHKRNYFLLANYNFSSMNNEPFNELTGEDVTLDNMEAKFQISFKFMLWDDLFRKYTNGDLFFGYTQLSMWQLYSNDISSPFRDTNFEPELFLSFENHWKIFGFTNRLNYIGIVHQSNGRSDPLSRSWNRVFATFVFNRGNFAWALKAWWRIPEDEESDDNPDIQQYLGYGELRAAYKWGRQTFDLMWRNNLDFDENRGAVEIGWTFPLPGTDRIKGYVQYFNGYGQCLLDYNASASTFGAGFLLTDWL